MSSKALYGIFLAVLDGINEQSRRLSDEDVIKLSHLFSDNLIVAALDLIDKDKVTCFKIASGRTFFEVQGSTATYSVQIDLPPRMPVFCDCPAFAFSVLLSEDSLLCKHVLAVMLARRLGRCVERDVSIEDLPSRLSLMNGR